MLTCNSCINEEWKAWSLWEITQHGQTQHAKSREHTRLSELQQKVEAITKQQPVEAITKQ